MILPNPIFFEDCWNETQLAFLRAYFDWSKDEDRSFENCVNVLSSFYLAFPCRNRNDFAHLLIKLGFENDPNRIDELCDLLEEYTQNSHNHKNFEDYLQYFPVDELRCDEYVNVEPL